MYDNRYVDGLRPTTDNGQRNDETHDGRRRTTTMDAQRSKRRTDDKRRTTDGGRRTTDDDDDGRMIPELDLLPYKALYRHAQ